MVSWNKLRIGKYKARINKIEKEREKFENCDLKGKPITAQFKRSPKKYLNEAGKEVFSGDVYKLVNGKARRKLKRTSEIESYEEINPNEVKDLIIECYYLIDCEKLRKDLLKKRRVIKTFFTHGNGFKIYEAYIVPFRKWLIMVLGFGSIEEQIRELLLDYIPQEKRAKIEDADDVERTNEKELLAIYQKRAK